MGFAPTHCAPQPVFGLELLAVRLPADVEWEGKRLKAWPQWLLDGKSSPTGRFTFTTWHHWTKDDALLDSGLLGPVQVVCYTEAVAE